MSCVHWRTLLLDSKVGLESPNSPAAAEQLLCRPDQGRNNVQSTCRFLHTVSVPCQCYTFYNSSGFLAPTGALYVIVRHNKSAIHFSICPIPVTQHSLGSLLHCSTTVSMQLRVTLTNYATHASHTTTQNYSFHMLERTYPHSRHHCSGICLSCWPQYTLDHL